MFFFAEKNPFSALSSGTQCAPWRLVTPPKNLEKYRCLIWKVIIVRQPHCATAYTRLSRSCPSRPAEPDADRTRSQMDMGCGRMMCDRCPILGGNDGALHSTAAVRLGWPLAVRDGVERPWAVRGRARRQCPVTDMCGRVVVTARPEREVIRDEVGSSGETMDTSCKNAEQKEASHVRSKQGHGASHR